MAQLLSSARGVNILKEFRMLRISESNPCCFLFLCLWQTFLLFQKVYGIFPSSASISTIFCIVYFWHIYYHMVAFLFIDCNSFASPRKCQGATKMVKQRIWLNAHIYLTGRCIIEVCLQLSIFKRISFNPVFQRDMLTDVDKRRVFLQMLHFYNFSKMYGFLPILCYTLLRES